MRYRREVQVSKAAVALALLAALTLAAPWGGSARAQECEPTRPDMLGPFYEPGAPERSKVGEGYVLAGRVLSSGDCSPLEGARIEFWMVGPEGRYDDAHRATVFSGEGGSYRFESNFPPGYFGRPPHIHILVSAEGHRTLVTQHYPERGTKGASFDLVLIPER